MSDDLALLPSLDAYVSAFAAIENQITENQRQMLTFHHAAHGRTVSATTLAEAVRFRGYKAANIQYGRLGSLLCRELDLDLAEERVGVLVDFVSSDQAANREILWVMRERVAVALEELSWVPRASQYLYPGLAIQALRSQPTNRMP